MILRWLPFIVLIVVNFLLDWFIYRKLKGRKRKVAHVILSTALFGCVVFMAFTSVKTCSDSVLRMVMWMLYIYMACYIPRLVALPFYWLSLPKFLRDGTRRFVRRSATVVGVLVFLVMLWGALVTPRTYEVRRVTIEYDNLPDAFDGYQIAQFSDIHLGSRCPSDTAFVVKYVNAINGLKPDMICFTGDIVNRYSREVLPFRHILSRLHAPDGVMAISGNHDYPDYTADTQQQKEIDHQRLVDIEKKMGWTPLENDYRFISRGSDSITVIGLENYGYPPLPNYGKYQTTYPDYDDKRFKILLTHGPNLWLNFVVKRFDDNIALTLSGHTHAMQMELRAAGKRWSPAALVYRNWGGLYQNGQRYHYVNIGLGVVGHPARIGAVPEITLITLKKKK